MTDEAADAGGQSGDLTPVSEPAVREVKFPNGNVAPLLMETSKVSPSET